MSRRFQVLGGDMSGECWIIHDSDNPAEAFAELKRLEERAFLTGHYVPMAVWDDQRDRRVVDLDDVLGILEEEHEEA